MSPLVVLLLLGFSSTFAAKDRRATQLLLDINLAKWNAQNAVAYTMSITRSGFLPVGAVGPFEVVVKNGEIVSVDPDNDFSKNLPTVKGLFKIIQKAIDNKAETIEVTYDFRRGYARKIFIDKSKLIADEEIGFEVVVSNVVKGQPVQPKPIAGPTDNGFSVALHKYQRGRFDASGLKTYNFRFEGVGDLRGPFIIKVKNGKIIKALFAESKKPVPIHILKKLPTLRDLFPIVLKKALSAAKVKVIYDARYGYPLSTTIKLSKKGPVIVYKAKILH